MASAAQTFTKNIGKVIRLNRHGCTNRPFYHIVVQKTKDTQDGPVIEQVGSFDAMPNSQNEKLVALNLERIQYWLAQGAGLSEPVAQLLGLSGFLPNHPRTIIEAWRNRQEVPRERKVEVTTGVAHTPNNSKL
uniref:Small ribosomal subunit protein bS16m n=1 Tax=Ceriodaphnia reticulata TaxID=302197 RepID=A0A4Y7LWM8_9CRUS|nr:EOG090X0KAD [Ceriodaphnia reticulata]SVE73331.1 EOG090X0KAD [Ceriodaphnia reticulata]